MADNQVTVKTRKFLRNPLLQRRQMIVDIIHPNLPPVKKETIRAELSKMYKTDVKNVVVFGFKTPFGGGRSTGFGLVYDNEAAAKKFEPKYRLVRAGLADAKKRTRKQFKDLKKKRRTTWGTGRRAEARKARKAAAA